ncbi:MAG: tetratricopeptide repeat protein [Arcticibacter sp.]
MQLKYMFAIWGIITFMSIAPNSAMAQSKAFWELWEKFYDYSKNGEYEKTLISIEQLVALAKNELGEDDTLYAQLLFLNSKSCGDLGLYSKKLILDEEILKLNLRRFPGETLETAKDISRLASDYYSLGDYKKSMQLNEKALRIRKAKLGGEHPDVAESLIDLATDYATLEEHKFSVQLLNSALKIYKNEFGNEHELVAICLHNLAINYKEMGDNNSALSSIEESIKIKKIIFGAESPETASSLDVLAEILTDLGEYENATPIFEETLRIRKKHFGNEHPDVTNSLEGLATCYSNLGDINSAFSLYDEILRNRLKTLGSEHPDVATSLFNMATIYFDLENYNKVVSLLEEAIRIQKNAFGDKHSSVANSLMLWAATESRLNQKEQALLLMEEAFNIYLFIYGKEHPQTAIMQQNIAVLYTDLGAYEKAIQLFEEGLKVYKKIYGGEHQNVGAFLYSMARVYYGTKDDKEAMRLIEESLCIRKKVFGNNHPEVATTLSFLSAVNYNCKKYKKAMTTKIEELAITKCQILKELTLYAEDQRLEYINKKTIDFEILDYFHAYHGAEYPQSIIQALNNNIFLNGIGLRSSQQLRRSILESGDSVLIEQYEDWIALKRRLIKADELTMEEWKNEGIDTDSIQDRIEYLERNLATRSKDFASIKEKDQLDYLKVKQSLKPNEAYVLFNSFPYFKNGPRTDFVLYGAYIIRPNQQEPQWVYLFEQRTLDSLLEGSNPEETINYIYTSADLYRSIWRPLELALQGAEQVMFSPAGSLHRVAFHAITDSTGHTLSQRYQLKQVSGATQVVYPANPILFEENSTSNAIALFGGINYQSTSTEMQQALQGLNIDTSLAFATRSLLPNEDQRGLTWNYLPGTKTEVTRIEGLFKSKGKNTMLYQDNLGLEDRLKRLESKQAPRVLHLATHGFYLPDPKQNWNQNMFQTIGEDNRFSRADNPLLRSGLLFAGASRTWKGEPTEPGAEDGILTAMEVANLDLRNTRMVVLSACQTALGDVKGKEGVFGLQRGFKLAGVDYIVMSLWPVPDKETSEFMELFYSNLLESNNIPQAFNQTRASMQNRYPNEPYKWAGMVLVE